MLSRFYDYLCRIPSHRTVMKAHSTGVWESRLRLYPDAFLAMTLTIPPLEEQIPSRSRHPLSPTPRASRTTPPFSISRDGFWLKQRADFTAPGPSSRQIARGCHYIRPVGPICKTVVARPDVLAEGQCKVGVWKSPSLESLPTGPGGQFAVPECCLVAESVTDTTAIPRDGALSRLRTSGWGCTRARARPPI